MHEKDIWKWIKVKEKRTESVFEWKVCGFLLNLHKTRSKCSLKNSNLTVFQTKTDLVVTEIWENWNPSKF